MIRGVPSLMAARGIKLFSPLDITGLKLWLKADSLSLTDGSAITAWTDSSGNGNDGSGGAFGNSTYKTAIQNGLPIARFDGTSSGVNIPAVVSAIPYTILIVANQTSKTTNGVLIQRRSGGSLMLIRLDITTGFFRASAGNSRVDAADHSGAFHVFTTILNSASSFAYVDGSQIIAADMGSNVPGTLALGTDGSAFLTGDIGEILVYDTSLSSTNRGLVEAYLKSKWATP